MIVVSRKLGKGFNLLEILLVITLIGILAGIALVSINPNRQLAQARNLKRKTDITNIYNALEIYTVKNRGNIYPGVSDLYKEICDTGMATNTNDLPELCVGRLDLSALVPDYLKEIPKDPQSDSGGGTGYYLAKGFNNQMSIKAEKAELSTNIAISDPPKLTPNCGGIIYSNKKILIPYTGGKSGYNYASQTINSTGVVGLKATLSAGTLSSSGNLEYIVSGYNNGSQAANFNIKDISNTYATCNNVSIAVNQLCPSGYIPVPGNPLYQTNNFCVMKYEAKLGQQGPVSKAEEQPIVNIRKNYAQTACSQIGADYGLITNEEWMTIARNIEQVPSNWRNNIVGSTRLSGGGLFKGHSNQGWNQFGHLAASSDDNQGYIGTGDVSGGEKRRTHILSNGEVIWDLSGNLMEYVDELDLPTLTNNPRNTNLPDTQAGWFEWPEINFYGDLSYDLTRPSNPNWNSNQNIGKYFRQNQLNTNGHSILRGGSFVDQDNVNYVGIFSLDLQHSIYQVYHSGFRCVAR